MFPDHGPTLQRNRGAKASLLEDTVGQYLVFLSSVSNGGVRNGQARIFLSEGRECYGFCLLL